MSFLSVEPQSRATLENHSNTLLSQFDTHLRILADRYLAFFQERRSIEAVYIDSLRKLHRKASDVDVSFDARFEPTNTRVAWDRVRDNLENEASTKQTFVDILEKEVIEPLKSLKQTNDMTRKQIEKSLRLSTASYADHVENKISKLQQAYLKKYHPEKVPEDVRNKRFGGKVSALFRGLREDLREPELAKPAKDEEVSDDDCRLAVSGLNVRRWSRVEDLEDGYHCLEELVFTPTIKDVLMKYMDGMITTYAKYDDLAMNTKAEAENVLDTTDTSDLRASFHRALSFSIPPLTLYRNYRPGGYSNLIFGIPLVDHVTSASEGNVPKVMRMCMEEVEKRGLDIDGLYPEVLFLEDINDTRVLELRHRFETEKSFSLSSTDNILPVSFLLLRYLCDLPEPLLVLSLQEYRDYRQNKARNTENDFSLLRSKIRGLHPVHRDTLGTLLRHLSHVTSHSDKVKIGRLAKAFCYSVFRRRLDDAEDTSLKNLVMEDLIQNAQILFDESPTQSAPLPSSNVPETTSTYTHGPELPLSATQHHLGLVGGIRTSSQLSFSSSPSDATTNSRPTPLPITLPSPLVGLSSSKTFTEGLETATHEQVAPEPRARTAVAALPDSTPPDAEYIQAPMSVAEWRLHQSRLPPDPEAGTTQGTIPQSPPSSMLSSASDFPLSSATSLQTRTWGLSP